MADRIVVNPRRIRAVVVLVECDYCGACGKIDGANCPICSGKGVRRSSVTLDQLRDLLRDPAY